MNGHDFFPPEMKLLFGCMGVVLIALFVAVGVVIGASL